jgi:hypothetical protein
MAYNRVERDYLLVVMEELGFHSKWISLVMTSITAVHYSVLINGKPHGYIVPSGRLRQGNPLSPYLFLFCAEGLGAHIQKAEIDKHIPVDPKILLGVLTM